MFIEAAFFRFCEGILKSPFGRFDWTEQQIRGLFAQSIVDELSSRLIQYPSLRVHMEKKYPISRDVMKSLPADVHANFAGKDLTTHLHNYGFNPHNWIEIKYFSSKSERKYSIPRTENMASIVKDILRLIILTGAKRGIENRYLIVVFDSEPRKYLAMKNTKYGRRKWLEMILDNRLAEKELDINFSLEPKSFLNKIGSSKKIGALSLKLYSQTFLPKIDERYFDEKKMNADRLLVYCYLFRIDDFNISFDNKTMSRFS